MKKVTVISITPTQYYRRIVRMVNVKTGQQRELLYGDSVSERWIRSMAPHLWEKALPIKNKG